MAKDLSSLMYLQHNNNEDSDNDVVVVDDDFGFFHVEPFSEDNLPLSQWELINPSDADSDSCSDSDTVEEGSLPPTPLSDVLKPREPVVGFFVRNTLYSPYYDREDDDDGDDEDEDEDDHDDGLDDELVPRHLRGKLERGRMRKLGKRSFSKMNNSKRSPHLYVKPGCLYGKHGLGLKHSL